jgi:hypothetical protein
VHHDGVAHGLDELGAAVSGEGAGGVLKIERELHAGVVAACRRQGGEANEVGEEKAVVVSLGGGHTPSA